MGKVSRADYAETTPWTGIIGKPSGFGVSDISGLTGIGYSGDQIPVYDATTGRFRPGSRNPSSPTPTPDPTPGPAEEIWVYWDAPSLHPLQTATEDFDFVGAMVSQPVIVGSPLDLQFMSISAYCFTANSVRISVTNMNLADVDLGGGTWRLRIFS
jgi:hypothetical protein